MAFSEMTMTRPSDEERWSGPEAEGPRPELAERMCRIWEAALGAGPVQPDDDYFALGGDSLQAIEILAEVQAVFGARLPMSSLFDAPTPARLAALADEGVDPDALPLFRLSRSGLGAPLFLMPGAGADAFVFDDLLQAADLGRPVYSFRLPARGTAAAEPPRLSDVAARYAEQLVAVQPDGPYYLAGYSFGGRLAFEIARKLEADGRPVTFLGLIDTYGPGYPPALPLIPRIFSHIRWATHPDPDQRRRYFRERWWRIRWRFAGLTQGLMAQEWPHRLIVPEYIRTDYLYHRWLSATHEPAPYAGRVTLFRALEEPDEVGADFSDPFLGWGGVAGGGVDIRPVPGDHLTLLEPPHVAALARSLRECLPD